MYRKSTLTNGLRIVTTHAPHARSVSTAFFIGAGSRYEPSDVQGISHFIEHMMFKGTPTRPTAKDVSSAIEQLGGVFNAETSKEATVYWDKVAARHWLRSADILCDILVNSLFDPKEIEKERHVIVEELSMLVDSPHDWVHILADEVIWGKHPLGGDVGGTKESVQAISREQMFSFMGGHYVPENTVVSVAGPIEHDEIVGELERRLGSWVRGSAPTWQPLDSVSNGTKVRIKNKKTEQAHFCLTFHSTSYVHPDRYVLDLLNVILGEGMSSRLFVEVREHRGLAYDVHSYLNRYRDAGSAVIYAGVDPSKVDEALRAIIDQIRKLREGVGEDELERAKDYWKGRLELRLEETRALASWIGGQELLLGRVIEVDDVVAAIDRVTIEDVKRVANEIYDERLGGLAVIGPFRRETQFAKLLDG